MAGPSTMPPGLRAFALQRGIPTLSWHDRGHLTLVVDGRYRLQFRPDIGGRVAFSARIAALPAGLGDVMADRWLARMTNVAAGRLRDSAATLCIAGALSLQQSLAADLSADEVGAEIGEFVDALEFWIREAQRK
ncbi:type III secretion system chaperone [Propionivibrio dicarboxylicus]|uniref:Tir chaperone protein (CesT) family protein n=1 Tax=Propionivibrio dicarboxylicus TaxID=83767 RepID=A0A1G7WTP2_9RHOO|nr:type III secretion system chaperone [Propionivibrio dicarboxylicus]SDG75266.1 hypothetical protein SAMN05660652_00629 [Propionivibrio dicarboxylicus]